MTGVAQSKTEPVESEFVVESRKLDQAVSHLQELISQLMVRTEIIRVSEPTSIGRDKELKAIEPILSSLGLFLQSQKDKVRDMCRQVETILNELRI